MTESGPTGAGLHATAVGGPQPGSIAGQRPDSVVTTDEAIELANHLVEAWGSWGPTMTPDARRVAFISDRTGVPELWVQDVALTGVPPAARRIRLSDDPVISVAWSADSAWLACCVATGGGVRSQVWVVRPDGTDARCIAGSAKVHAELGPWTRSGHRVVVTFPPAETAQSTFCFLADPANGELHPLASGDLLKVLDLSVEERLVVVRDGKRGFHFCVVVDRLADRDHPLFPTTDDRHTAERHTAGVTTAPATGDTEVALLRPAPRGEAGPLIAYLATDEGYSRRRLVSMPLGPGGWRGEQRVLAERADAELEMLDADDAGRLLLLVWNAAGCSEIELLDTGSGERTPVSGLPGLVASSPVLSRDGRSVILSVEGPERPRELWHLDTATHSWARVTAVPSLPGAVLVHPTLESYPGKDGLPLTGWLYRVPGRSAPGPAMVSLHGGPEAQERPAFSPQHQAMVAAGITVFAPNVRGSSGFGRAFVHADDVGGRYGAFDDVLATAEYLVVTGVADARRVAVTGRSYGGYLALSSLAFSPGNFAAGVDICGMSDLLTFYRDTEPWIAAAAVTKYGHPRRDRRLLRAISPLRSVANITVPLLVAHGELDTNVPVGEARQLVAALRRLGRDVEYLQLAGEGHDYRRADSRRMLIVTMVRFLVKHLRTAA